MAGWGDFTPREQATITLLCRGCTNKEIAALTGVTTAYIKQRVMTNILRKLGVGFRTEVVAYAAQHWPWLFGERLSKDDDPVLYG